MAANLLDSPALARALAKQVLPTFQLNLPEEISRQFATPELTTAITRIAGASAAQMDPSFARAQNTQQQVQSSMQEALARLFQHNGRLIQPIMESFRENLQSQLGTPRISPHESRRVERGDEAPPIVAEGDQTEEDGTEEDITGEGDLK